MFSHSSLSLTLSNSVLWYLLFTACSRLLTLTTWKNRVKSIDFILTVTRSQEAILFEILFFFFHLHIQTDLKTKGTDSQRERRDERSPFIHNVWGKGLYITLMPFNLLKEGNRKDTVQKRELSLTVANVFTGTKADQRREGHHQDGGSE